MTPTPPRSHPFVRMTAIAVEGALRAFPNMERRSLADLAVLVAAGRGATVQYPKPGRESFDDHQRILYLRSSTGYRTSFVYDRGNWRRYTTDTSYEEKDVEREVARFFSKIFPTDHVQGRSIRIAEALIEDAHQNLP